MIVLIVLIVIVAAMASSFGAPMPVAILAGLVLPFAGSALYLRLSKQDAPTNKLPPHDPRTARFLSMLMARYRDQGFDEGVTSLEQVSRDYEAGRWAEANSRFGRLTSVVARSPYATILIGIWQSTWRDAANPGNRRSSLRSVQPAPARRNGARMATALEAVSEPTASDGPWTAANAERDAGLFLRAVLYSLVTPTVPASAQGYASAIAKTVTEGNEKALLVLLSGITYFVSKVHLLRGDPFDDPSYPAYSRLLAAHFMNAATPCLPGPNAPADKIRVANAGRVAADISGPSMALVEALGIVGTSAIEARSRA
jgi:hypothetical protein